MANLASLIGTLAREFERLAPSMERQYKVHLEIDQHMTEVRQKLVDTDGYFNNEFYSIIEEFSPIDDEAFMIHHYNRTLYMLFLKEWGRFRRSPLARALERQGYQLPPVMMPGYQGAVRNVKWEFEKYVKDQESTLEEPRHLGLPRKDGGEVS